MIMEHNFETNDNETVKLYDILRQFGAAGLGYVLKYFHDERTQLGETDIDTDDCMFDIYMNTQMLTHRELSQAFPNEKDYHVLLKNEAYVLVETF